MRKKELHNEKTNNLRIQAEQFNKRCVSSTSTVLHCSPVTDFKLAKVSVPLAPGWLGEGGSDPLGLHLLRGPQTIKNVIMFLKNIIVSVL